VVLECAPLQPQSAGNTVLTGYTYQLHSGRQRFTPALAVPRKPPASTWSATTSWQHEDHSLLQSQTNSNRFALALVEEESFAGEEDICA
jgi:hypothetical protein